MTQNAKVSSPLDVLEAFRESIPSTPRRIVFTQPHDNRVLSAASSLRREGWLNPVLLGDPATIRARAQALGLAVGGMDVLPVGEHSVYRDVWRSEWTSRGIREVEADDSLRAPFAFARAMVRAGDADAFVYGPAREAARVLPGHQVVGGAHLLLVGSSGGFGLVVEPVGSSLPSAVQLAEAASLGVGIAERLTGQSPSVVFLAPSVPASLERRVRFQSAREELEGRVRRAIETLLARDGDLLIAGKLSYDLSEHPASEDGQVSVFVLTQPDSIPGAARVLGAEWIVGPVYQRGGEIRGKLADGDTAEQIALTARLTALSVPST